MVTVRPIIAAARTRAAVRSLSRSSSRWMTTGSSMSWENVSSDPMLFSRVSRTTVRSSRPQASACRWPPATSPSASPERLDGRMRDVGDRAQAEPGEGLLGSLPHPPEGADGELVEEPEHLGLGDDDHPVGLGQAGGELGDELRRRHAHRAGDALLVGDGVADPLRDPRRAAETTLRAGDVEERLVERERFDDVGHGVEGRHDRLGDLGVAGEVGFDDDRLRTEPAGLAHRHRRGHAEPARLVGRRQHHGPVPAAADDDRLPAQVGPVDEGRGRVEGVHVDVEHGAAGVVRLAVTGPPWRGVLTPAHGPHLGWGLAGRRQPAGRRVRRPARKGRGAYRLRRDAGLRTAGRWHAVRRRGCRAPRRTAGGSPRRVRAR